MSKASEIAADGMKHIVTHRKDSVYPNVKISTRNVKNSTNFLLEVCKEFLSGQSTPAKNF